MWIFFFSLFFLSGCINHEVFRLASKYGANVNSLSQFQKGFQSIYNDCDKDKSCFKEVANNYIDDNCYDFIKFNFATEEECLIALSILKNNSYNQASGKGGGNWLSYLASYSSTNNSRRRYLPPQNTKKEPDCQESLRYCQQFKRNADSDCRDYREDADDRCEDEKREAQDTADCQSDPLSTECAKIKEEAEKFCDDIEEEASDDCKEAKQYARDQCKAGC